MDQPTPGTRMLFTCSDVGPVARYNGHAIVQRVIQNLVGEGLWGVQVKGDDPHNTGATWVAWPSELTTIGE